MDKDPNLDKGIKVFKVSIIISGIIFTTAYLHKQRQIYNTNNVLNGLVSTLQKIIYNKK